jgi:hypothetical protein
MFRGLSSGKFNQLYEVFGTGPLMPDTLNTFRALLDQPFPKHWRAKVPQQLQGVPAAHPTATGIASLTIEVRTNYGHGGALVYLEVFSTEARNGMRSVALFAAAALRAVRYVLVA